VCVCVCVCTELLPPGGYPIAVKYIILRFSMLNHYRRLWKI